MKKINFYNLSLIIPLYLLFFNYAFAKSIEHSSGDNYTFGKSIKRSSGDNYTFGKSIKRSSGDSLSENQANLEVVILKPQIRSIDNLNETYFSLSELNTFLRKIIIIDIPNLQHIKKYKHESLQPINLFKHIDISNGLYSYVVSGEHGEKFLIKDSNFLANGLIKDLHYDYTLLKPDFSYYHPITGEYLGTGMLKVGTATMVKRGKISVLNLKYCNEIVKAGTLIIPEISLNLVNNIKLIKNENKLRGYVISIISNKKIGFKKDIILITLGARDGVKIGNLFKINHDKIIVQDPYNNKQHILPSDIVKSEILIYEVFDKLSIGIIIKSDQKVNILDEVISN